MTPYAELAVTTNFSFLRGASHPEELTVRAAELGLAGIGVADRNSLAGVVRAHVALRDTEIGKTGLKLAVGARLVFSDGTPDILAYPQDRAAYGRLCRLLTVGKRRADKGECILGFEDLEAFCDGLLLAVMAPRRPDGAFRHLLERLDARAPGRVWIAASMLYSGTDDRRLDRLMALGRETGLLLLAVNDVLYHVPERQALQDIVTCIREHVTIEEAGLRLLANAERHLKAPAEMAHLFHAYPEAIEETTRFLARIHFSLDELQYHYPDETRQGYATPQEALEAFAFQGARERYPDSVPEKVRAGLAHELKLIGDLNYAPYFLTVHDIVRFACSKGILCQGRGSAANSTICYCLGITEVDPSKNDLLFERFVSTERNEPPDIDVDFEHERREEVIQYLYERYGRDRAGLAATVITYRARSATREVSKVFGLSDDTISALAGMVWGWSSSIAKRDQIQALRLDPDDPDLARVMEFSQELIGFPRHLSQHVGGFVITHTRLDEVVPIENAAMDDRTVVEWNKDDLDALKILKVDVLGLGMLTCLKKAFELIERHYGETLTLANIPREEDAVYRMLSRADSLGVFQVESRAQMSMLPRLKPANFYDLVIEVAIVRPGPIQGNMVHPYLRRRQRLEKVHYPAPAPGHGPPDELYNVLHKTLGVPLFQEQAMKIAIVAAGFTPSEADRLRRAMATFRRLGTIGTFQAKMVEGMVARGYERAFAERCFDQIKGFGDYGFPESHAASFAILVYASAWIKCRYPDVFAAALLNSQPMGFYAPAQIVRDAREHGVEVRPMDVNTSGSEATLEPGPQANDRLYSRHADMSGDIRTTHALRLGFNQIRGLDAEASKTIVACRGMGYDSVRDLWLRTELPVSVLERLAEADAFRSIGLDRRDALWAVRGLNRAGDQDDLPLFSRPPGPRREPGVTLPAMPLGEHVLEDYRHLSLSLKAHPVSFLRERLAERGIMATERLPELAPGKRVTVAGLVLVRQRPGKGNVIFMTLEDETGIANALLWPRVFERFRPTVLGARFIAVTGMLQSESGVIHVIAERLDNLSPLLAMLVDLGGEIRERVAATTRVMPKGRNFH